MRERRQELGPGFLRHAAAFVLVSLSAWAIPGVLTAADRFPSPEFDSGYSIPTASHPLPLDGGMALIDVLALVFALSLAAYAAHRLRSRNVIAALSIASLLYFGFVRHGCVCPVGSIQNVAFAAFGASEAAPLAVVAFFTLPLAFALMFGRVFCGCVCPLGAIQDVVALRPTKVPDHIAEALGFFRYAYLAVAAVFATTGSAFVICRYDPFVPIFRLTGTFPMIALGASLLMLGVFVARPYCRFLCPYGALLSLASRLSIWKTRITPFECISCRLCEDACPFGAIDGPTEPERGPARGRRFAAAVAAIPVLVLAGAGAGYLAASPMSRVDPEVSLSERVALEDAGAVSKTSEESDAFRASGRTAAALHDSAIAKKKAFRIAATAACALLGLVLGLKIALSLSRRPRAAHEADRSNCVACGRCYSYCPIKK